MPFNNFREDETSHETVRMDLVRRLFRYLIPYRLKVLVIIALMGVVIGIELLNPYFLKLAIDHYIVVKDIPGLLGLGLVVIGFNGIALLCARHRIQMMSGVTHRILLTIRQELYSHIQQLSLKFFESRPAGKILARIIGDVNSLSDLFSNSVTNLLPDLATIVAVSAIMLSINSQLALYSLLPLPLLMGFMAMVQIFSHPRWRIHRKKVSNTNAFTHEIFSGIRVVQSFSAESRTSSTFSQLLRETLAAFVRAVRLNDLFWPSVEFSWGISTVTVFWIGVQLLNTGTITIGTLVAFSGYIAMFWHPVMNISNFYNTLVSNMSGAERIFEIMDIPPLVQDATAARPLPPIQGEVVFDNVCFGYDPDQLVLDQVSFIVKPGETVALVGPTGAGKSSIVNLVSRFYDVRSGAVRVDGFNVKEVTLESLRTQMGVVLQDTFLFSGSIKENIRFGKLDASDAEIVAAARAVHAHDFIMKLEHGYDTDVHERGSRLSFGQRQQIAFARALLANPRILILDEATAGMDTHTERLIQAGIKQLLTGRTSFVIAHRLSTIRHADRIMVIDQGRIVEQGSHSELFQRGGLYHQLFMAQFRFLNGSGETAEIASTVSS